MNLKSAIQNIVNLAKLKHYEEHKNLNDFDVNAVLSLSNSDDSLDAFIEEKKIPLFNPDDLSLSASSVKNYKDCPLKFKFDKILSIPTKRKTYFDLGTAVHAVAEHLTTKQKDGVEPTEKLAFEILEKEWNSNAYESKTKERQDYALAQEMVRTFLEWT